MLKDLGVLLRYYIVLSCDVR